MPLEKLLNSFLGIILSVSQSAYCSFMVRFIGNSDLCGRQVHKPCRTSLGFPAVLPHAASDEAAGKFHSKFSKTF
jgi:hypothetical protein